MNESIDIAGLRIETERVDDIPLLVGQMRRMELPEVLDSRVVVHGNRQGLSIGWTVVVWLAHVLSEADHRLSQVRPWAARRLETLRACTGQEIREEAPSRTARRSRSRRTTPSTWMRGRRSRVPVGCMRATGSGATSCARPQAEVGREGSALSPALSGRIQARRGGGQPLEATVRRGMVGVFGVSFGHVRIHADPEADLLNRGAAAIAFTVGSDIFFRAGAYQPHSAAGQHLLAHELTHVVQ